MTENPPSIFKMNKKGSFPPFSLNSSKTHTLDSSVKISAFNKHDGSSGSQASKVLQKNPVRSKGNLFSNTNTSSNDFNSRNNRPLMQRGRGNGNGDKRGRARGGTETSKPVVNRKDEAGSLQSPGGRKQNLDLWGFRFAPRENRDSRYGSGYGRSHPPSGGYWHNQNVAGLNHGRYGKDYAKHFLLANCQFLVRLGEDYTVYLADPNLLVNWDFIEHVRIRIDGEMPKCPICLDFPIAAKITKCGHIYCWPCFLHYLALSDHKNRTCPICYEAVSRGDLKSVSILTQNGVQVGSEIEMQLMVRLKNTSVAVPYEKFEGWETMFCKIIQIAPKKVIEGVIAREREELDFVFCSEPDAPEVCFIQEALAELSQREALLIEMNANLVSNFSTDFDGLVPVELDFAKPKTNVVDSTSEAGSKKQRNDSVSSNSSGGFEDQHARKSGNTEGHYFFYQIRDGHNVYLHPLNMAMLWRELGPDPEKWPQVLTFKVIDVEAKSATEVVKKRMKFVRHLPKNAPFDLVEVSMEGWGISPEVLADFSSQISQREQKRLNRAKEEKVLERKQRERDALEFNKFCQNMPQISSPQEFPAFGFAAAMQNMPLLAVDEDLDMDGANIGVVDGRKNEATIFESISVTSFAQIAGKAPLKRSPTYPIVERSVAMAADAVTRHSESEQEGEDYVPVPNYAASMSDAIEKAMAGLALSQADGEVAVPNAGAGNKKKKNKKGKVLFATGMGAFH